MHSPYRAVIFDLDGTLFYTLPSIAKGANTVLLRLGLPTQPLEVFASCVGHGVREQMRRLMLLAEPGRKEVDEKLLDEAERIYHEVFIHYCNYEVTPYPGIVDLIGELSERGVALALLSNKPQAMTEIILNSHFPARPFRVLQGAVDAYPLKPDPAAALSIAARLDLPPSRFCFVGDSAVDMRTAINAGMLPVGVLWGYRDREELLAGGAAHLIREAGELLPILAGNPS